jgi:hypothetical protein
MPNYRITVLEQDLTNAYKVLQAHKQRLADREVQKAIYGVSADPVIKIEIKEINDKIQETQKRIDQLEDELQREKDKSHSSRPPSDFPNPPLAKDSISKRLLKKISTYISRDFRRFVFILSVIFVIYSFAVYYPNISRLIQETSTSTPNATLPPQTTITAISNGLLVDRFDDNRNGWDVRTFDQNDRAFYAKSSIEGGAYYLSAKTVTDTTHQGCPSNGTVLDFVVFIDGRKVYGSDDSSYGLVFRFQDVSNFYIIRLRDDKLFSVRVVSDGNWRTLIDWTKVSEIIPGAFNKIGVIAKGAQLSFSINDVTVGSINDNTLRDGKICPFIQLLHPNDEGQAVFDNYSLTPQVP